MFKIKTKNIEMILKQCDILLIQETWALPREVGKINQYFPEYNTYGVSGIKDDILLAGRPYGGCSFLYKKSLSAKTEFMTMDSDRMCCVSLIKMLVSYMFSMYIFHVTTPHNVTYSCTMKCWQHYQVFSLIKHNVVNCIIGVDLNTDLSRARSGNTQGWGQVQYLYLVLVLKYIFIST